MPKDFSAKQLPVINSSFSTLALGPAELNSVAFDKIFKGKIDALNCNNHFL